MFAIVGRVIRAIPQRGVAGGALTPVVLVVGMLAAGYYPHGCLVTWGIAAALLVWADPADLRRA